jgi:hypothetical protein
MRYVLARSAGRCREAEELRERFWQRQAESVAALVQATHAADAPAALQAVNPTVARKWHRPQIPAALRLFDFATHGRYVDTAAPRRPSRAYRDLTPEQQAQAREAIAALATWIEQGDPAAAQVLTEAARTPEGMLFEGSLGEMFAPNPSAPEMKVGDRVLCLRGRDGVGRTVLEMRVHIGPVPLPEVSKPSQEASAVPPAATRSLRLEDDERPLLFHPLLSQIARQTRLAVFADDYYCRPRPMELPVGWEGRLEALLRRLETDAQTEWTLDGSALRLRDRRWYVAELREPPRSVLETVGATLRRQGQLDLDDCVRAAAMDDAQLEGFKAWAGSQDHSDLISGQLQPLAEAISNTRPLLRLYGSLSSAQRQALATGLTLEALQLSQQPMFLEATLRLLPAATSEQRSRMRLRLDSSESGVVFVALFPDELRVERQLPVRPSGP